MDIINPIIKELNKMDEENQRARTEYDTWSTNQNVMSILETVNKISKQIRNIDKRLKKLEENQNGN